MAVQKAVELTGTGATVEDAIGEALDRARLTLEGTARLAASSPDRPPPTARCTSPSTAISTCTRSRHGSELFRPEAFQRRW